MLTFSDFGESVISIILKTERQYILVIKLESFSIKAPTVTAYFF